MSPKLQLKFDANQEHQLQAVESVVRLFEAAPRFEAAFQLGDEIVANLPEFADLPETLLLTNLAAIQAGNGVAQANALEMDQGLGLERVCDEGHRYPNFTVEMETGTGKTYVYLRTIYELRRRFGWSKFVIVVPSIAIYEGVVKNVQITRDHFRALYGNEPFDLIPYDGGQLSRLRHFATANTTTVLLITLDAFNKVSNNLYKASEKLPGDRRPYQFIQATRPILILDEPQNMESEKSRQALRTLKPLLALRYSATHRASPNLIYRLSPLDAFQRSLVKRIQVYAVTERDNANAEVLTLLKITPPPKITAVVRTRVTDLAGTRETDVTLRQGDDLFAKTQRPEYRGGFIVENIDAGHGFVEFRNGQRLYPLEGIAAAREAIFREQIRQTILQHMRMQSELLGRDIKVLSLFFVDRVASYRDADGLVRRLFDEEFARAAPDFGLFRGRRPDQVRQAYFAQRKGKDGRPEEVDTAGRTADEREAEKRAFQLIMRDKERLLSLDEPVSFIFAHSALKEGWDNPNVTQICTLRHVGAEMERRQQIGRGLRLVVDQRGERVHDEDANTLTVVANESFTAYARGLQTEYVNAGDAPPPPPTDAKAQRTARRNDQIYYRDEHFERFWEQLNRCVRYRLKVDSEVLIAECVNRLDRAPFPGRVLVVERGRINLGTYRVRVEKIEPGKVKLTLTLFDEDGNPTEQTRFFKPGDDIARVSHEEALRPLGTIAIEGTGSSQAVLLTNTSVRLAEGQEWEYTPEGFGSRPTERLTQVRADRHPVFNLVERAARQTGLTRPTINAIFRRLRADRKAMVLQNPEGFAAVFIGELRNALADHITARIEFVVEPGDAGYDRDALFPAQRRFPQKEVIEAGEHGLYDLVQKDSGVEQEYIDAIKAEHDAVVFYFKFPPGFKVGLPALIGNYNPDWGVAHVQRDGKVTVRAFVHETKGTTEIAKLQFPHEKRKIECAKKYFATIGVNYLTIDPKKVGGWWEENDNSAMLSL